MRKLVSYDGVTALITGASSGIGRLTSKRMAITSSGKER